ncbi:MAG TPA: DUF445 family protein, partial [Halanaerobiales bacterium]|nr:DUF445 family protein [Halanaerobiales bacterium]
INIPIFNIKIQGLLPSRRDELAESIAVSIEDNLLSIDNILEEFDHDLIKEELNLIIEDTINKKINENFKYVMPKMLKDISREIIVDIIKEEVHNNFEDWMETLGERIKEEIDIKEMIEEKIKSFSLITLEDLVLDIAERELKHIEYLGGVIGFIIGLGQLILIMFI